MRPTDERQRVQFWASDSPSVIGMLRVEREDRVKTTYVEHFSVVVIDEGAFDGWYRGAVRTHVAGALKLKEPGEVHRDLRIHAPFTLRGAALAADLVTAAAETLGLRGPAHFKASGFDAGAPATQLAFALHAALARPDAPELERATLVAELLREILAGGRRDERAPRAVRRARAFLHDALADKITLDALAEHAGLDKFHLVRAFRTAVGVPPYEYLTHVRIAKAKALLRRGALVAEVAQAVGFYDESQLHRHFRRIAGITPGRFARCFTTRASQHRPSGELASAAQWTHDRTH